MFRRVSAFPIFGWAVAHSAFLYADVLRLSSRSFGAPLISRFSGYAAAHSAFTNAAVLRLSIRSLGESMLSRSFGREVANSAFLRAAVLRLSIRWFGESMLSRLFGCAVARSAFLNAAVLRLSSRSFGESLLSRLFGCAAARSAFLNADFLRLRRRPCDFYLLADLPRRRVVESPTSRVLSGWASSVANNCIVRSILQKLRGKPRLHGRADDENICATIRETMFARGGRPIGPPSIVRAGGHASSNIWGRCLASTPYGFSRPPARNTSSLGMGGGTSTFLIEMAILHLSGLQYADFISDVAILMRAKPASFSSGAEEGARRYFPCGGRFRVPQYTGFRPIRYV